MMEEVDIDKNGRVDKDEYLSYFSLVVGLMEDVEFLPIYNDLMESFEGFQDAQGDTDESDKIPGERLLKLQMLFQSWDPKNSGAVPKDLVFVLARACEPFTDSDAEKTCADVPDIVSRKEFISACVAMGVHTVKDKDFDAVIDPLLEKRL